MKILVSIIIVFVFPYINAYTQIRVVSNGSVGIGTNTPAERLDVLGGIKMIGNQNNYELRLRPDNPIPEIGGSQGAINFWHTTTGWNIIIGKIFDLVSDSMLKESVQPITNSLSTILQLNGVAFKYKDIDTTGRPVNSTAYDTLHPWNYGFIAQQVQKIIPSIVSETSKGYLSLNYDAIIPFIVEAIKEQHKVINHQDSVINEMNAIIAEQNYLFSQMDSSIQILNNLTEMLSNMIDVCCSQQKMLLIDDEENDNFLTSPFDYITNTTNSILYQNKPNPFSEQTIIEFDISEYAKNALLFIFDMQGALIKTYPIYETGVGNIIINAYELNAGMYLYTLIVDDKETDTKKMILIDK